MKILLVHNYYGSEAPSGENQVFEAEKNLLKSHGHEVELFTRHSDELRSKGPWGTLKGGLVTPWNFSMASAVKKKVESFLPDVVHVHNSFPLLSPAIFHAIGRRSAKVLTLHNYRLFCPAGIPMRNGKICTECLDRHSVLPALQHGCYRNSRIATVPLALSVALHRRMGTWVNQVDAFITLSEFQSDQMIVAGLPSPKVWVKPNFYPENPRPLPWAKREPFVIFAGRLSPEKGVRTLLQAWSKWGKDAPELRVVGEGPLRNSLEQMVKNTNVRFLGQLPPEEAKSQISRAKLLVLPSEWFEGFPMVIAEAFAFGTAAAVSDIGSLPSIIQYGKNGVLFKPGDPESLFQVIRRAWEKTGEMERLGSGARISYEESYGAESNYKILMDIYAKAIEGKNLARNKK